MALLLIIQRATGLTTLHFSSEVTQDPFSVTQPPNKILESCMNLRSGGSLRITTQIEFPINLVSEGFRVGFN